MRHCKSKSSGRGMAFNAIIKRPPHGFGHAKRDRARAYRVIKMMLKARSMTLTKNDL